jgi:hypothetical protein
MRFTIIHWLYLIPACIAASAVMPAVSGALWSALGFTGIPLLHGRHPLGLPGALNTLFAVALALGVLYVPLNALLAWPVLRTCVAGLRLALWLGATALGAMLGAIVSVPAMVFLLLVPGSVPPFPNTSPIGWLPPVAAGIAALLPPGLVLQRLSGVRAWPSIIALAVAIAGMAALPTVWGRVAVHVMVPDAMLLADLMPGWVGLGMAAAAVVMSGVLTALALGAGLYLMARARMPTPT